MSLYRKYRPQSFADVVGQDAVVTTLEQAAEQDKLTHAYLFAGSRGTGKTSVARILAKIIMIQGIDDETIQKQIIQGVEEGNIVDLLEIDAASNRGIDDIRDLLEKIQFSPVVANAKVYIIDEVHMLTKEAFNALLKTLEEPPSYTYFILATTEINKVPATIQSRCQCFPFRRIPEEDIIRRLQLIADQEHINIERDALRLISHHVDGGLRDAISLLDQMRSLEKVSTLDVQQRIGATGQEYIDSIFTALEENDTGTIIETIRKVEEAGVPLDVFMRQLLSIVRETLHEIIEGGKSSSEIVHMLDVLLQAIRDIRVAPVPGLVIETALLSLCDEDADPPPKKEKKSEKATKETKESKDSKEKEPEDAEDAEEPEDEKEPEVIEKPKEEQVAEVEAKEVTLESLQDSWPEILKQMSPPSVKMSLKNGKVHAVDEKKVTISFSSSFHKDKVADTEASRAVEEIMKKIFKRQLKLECILQDEQADTQVDEDTVNLADAAAEIF